ncbi:MAG: transcription elongation factor GreA [Calditrichaeota bacterium]|nr:MAG: transcription elongation factor GreA [Calditrichota bacterium]MBL1204149.1 transcription elongation factor GreA [Calditrichota bacterium]NOG43980.1 transcription elongation factor GreA [Calditrichota bacterium]
MEFVYLSAEGLEKLKKELHELKYVTRPKVTEKVSTARDHGDLKENAEYHAAREELSMVETKVQILQDRVARARIIDESEISLEEISILNVVKMKDTKTSKELTYTLVSDEEANFKEGKISVASPVGKGLIGKKVGDVAEIKVPAGILKYEILSIGLPE